MLHVLIYRNKNKMCLMSMSFKKKCMVHEKHGAMKPFSWVGS